MRYEAENSITNLLLIISAILANPDLERYVKHGRWCEKAPDRQILPHSSNSPEQAREMVENITTIQETQDVPLFTMTSSTGIVFNGNEIVISRSHLTS